jgi:hypothetical protein
MLTEIEVFLVAYTRYNLNFEIFAELGQTGNSAVCSFFVIENTITKVGFSYLHYKCGTFYSGGF